MLQQILFLISSKKLLKDLLKRIRQIKKNNKGFGQKNPKCTFLVMLFF